MKTKLKFFLMLLAMMVGGVNGVWAANIYEFYSYGGDLVNTNSKFEIGSWVNIYNEGFSASTTLADGTPIEITNSMKIDNTGNRYIRFTTSTTSTVYVSIVITDDAITASYHDFQLDEDHRNNGNVYPKNTVNTQTFSDITPGTHTIKSSSGGMAVYYVKVVENSFNNSYPYTWDFASNWGTETAAALNPTSYWELVSGSTTVVENVSNFIDSAFGYLWKGNSTSHPNIDKTDGIQFKASHPHLKLCPGQWIQGDASVSFKLLSVPANSLITIYTTSVDAGFSSVENAAGRKIDGVYKYAVTAQNDVTFNFRGLTQITKISVTTLDSSEGFLAFDKETDTYNLVDLSYTEPTLTVLPVGTTVTWSIDKYQVANFRETSNTGHDLLIVNTGEVNVTASATIGGQTYTASYKLTIIADEAVWDVRDGNECYFPTSNTKQGAPSGNNNTGKLLVRKVTSVPHITMEFGDASNSNMAMVAMRNGDSGAGTVRAANLIDQNGWQHVWCNNDNTDWLMKPYQGTFYKFVPAISGKLTIKGVRNHTNGNKVILVDKDLVTTGDWDDHVTAGTRTRYSIVTTEGGNTTTVKYYSYPIVKTFNFATTSTYAVTEEQVNLVGGHTYYLYAVTPNTDGTRTINRDVNPVTDTSTGGDWQNFYLTGFKYETNFKFNKQNVVMGNTTGVKAPGYNHIDESTTYTQTINDAGVDANISYSRECRGNINCSINSSTGELSSISGTGAIVVKATLTEGANHFYTYYVLTKPYTTITNGGTKSWVFNLTNYNYNGGSPTGDNQMEQISTLKSNADADEWGIEYKVRRYDNTTKALDYINVPVLTNALEVNGDNARYISTTAGLLFDADVSAFGTTTSVKTDVTTHVYKAESAGDGVGRVWAYKKYTVVDGVEVPYMNDADAPNNASGPKWVELKASADIDMALRALLNYNAQDAADPCNYITMENGTSMTIPNLKAGQYVRIKWSRYARNQGDRVRVSNLNDLNGTSVSDPITIGAGGNVDRNGGTGYHEFIVAADGDVTFTLDENGWANIYQVDVANEFIPTDLQLMQTSNWGTDSYGHPKETGWSDVPSYYVRKQGAGETVSQKYTANFGGTHSQSNSVITYAVKTNSGTSTLAANMPTISQVQDAEHDNYTFDQLNIGATGHGRFTLVQEGRVESTANSSTKYLLDRNEYEIKVFEYNYTQKTYPYTWNMKHVTTETGNTTVENLRTDAGLSADATHNPYWTASNSNNDFTLKVGNPENLMKWNYKSSISETDGTAIPELDGLGIIPQDMTDGTDNSITFKAGNGGQGLQLGAKDNTVIVPSVALGQTVYVAATGSGSISHNNSTLSSARTVSGTNVYEIAGSGSDVELVVNNMTINQVAVSKDTKTVTAAGYATEARDYPLDFTLAGTFLGTDQYAYKITGVENNMVIATRADYVPTGDGVMISGRGGYTTYWPLFTTDVDRQTSDMSSNKLVGVVTVPNENVEQSTVISGTTYYNYMLANGGYNVTMENGTPKVGTTVSGLGYYLVFATGTILSDGTSTYAGGKPAAHSAYLRLPSVLAVHQGLNSGGSARSVFFIDFDDEQTGIQKPMDGLSEKDNNVYYTIQGVRVDKPGKGLYIHNGRKVYVK